MIKIIILCLLVSAAHADVHPCDADAEKACPGLAKGPKLAACMKSHPEAISDACKKQVQTEMGIMKAAMSDCRADAKKFCSSVSPGDFRIVDCLEQNAERISLACKERLKNRP